VRAATGDRTMPWTYESLQATLPRPLIPDATWRVTASHHAPPTPSPNAAGGFSMPPDPMGALNYLGWTSGVPQETGMWFQVELPQPMTVAEVQFTSTAAVVDTTPAVPGAPTRSRQRSGHRRGYA
jgi:hypothetical protein